MKTKLALNNVRERARKSGMITRPVKKAFIAS
jgi:hypothetical protein